MRKRFYKVIAVALAGVMMMGMLAACGSGGAAEAPAAEPAPETEAPAAEAPAEEAPAAEAPTEEAGAYPDYSGGFPETVTIQIPVYDRAFEGWDVTNNRYTQWVQETFGAQYNVDVQFTAIGRATEVADYMQMIADGTAPSIVFHYDMPQMVSYLNEGALQALDVNEIANYAPTFWTNTQSLVETYGQMDGETMFVFGQRPTMYYQWMNLIRQDWLDEVGAALPTTQEELNAVAELWKEAGLGVLNENLRFNNFTYFYPWIGTSVNQDDVNLYMDLAVAPLPYSATENYLRNANYQFNNDLIDPEFYLRDDDAKQKAEFIAGHTGTYALYMSANTDVISSLLANDPNAKLAVLPPGAIGPAGNNPYYFEYAGYGMINGINSTCTPEQRAAVWMYLEWLSTSENLFQFQNGVEGETYTLDADGLATPVADYAGEWLRSANNNKDYWCLVVEAPVYGDETLNHKANVKNWAPAGYEYLVEDSYAFYLEQEPHGVISPVFTSPITATADIGADLRTLWQELYVGIVTGPEADFDANYAAAVEEYNAAGFQEIIDEKQALIDAGGLK